MHVVSIRRSLLWNLVLLVVVLGMAIFVCTAFFARKIVSDLSGMVIDQTLAHATDRLHGFFNPMQDELLQARSWAQSGLIDPDDPQAVRRLFEPVMREHPQITSALLADGRGHEVMLLRSGQTWRTRQTRRDEWGDRTLWHEWHEDGGEPVESWKSLDYDPRLRPWYQGAVAQRAKPDAVAEGVFWTAPYQFYTTREPGMTVSVAFSTPKHQEVVIGFDVLLNDISEFTQNLRVTHNGIVVVMAHETDEEDGEMSLRVVGLPAGPQFEDPELRKAALLKPPEEIGTQLARDATSAYEGDPHVLKEAANFESQGTSWWSRWKLMQLPPSRVFIICVVVPEEDLMQHLNLVRAILLGLLLLAFGVAVLRALVLSRRYSEPVEALVSQSDRISRGNLAAGPAIESTVKEVRQLAEAHERMRKGLIELFKLERDLQLAQQVQEGTFPDVLPELPGFELYGFSRPAAQTGGDSYDVIGYRTDARTDDVQLVTDKTNHAVLMLADATGHGFGPALAVSQVRAMLRMAVRMGQSLDEIVIHINEQLFADTPEGRFITAWFGHLDAATGMLTSFSAGQAPLLHFVAAKEACRALDSDTLPLGILAALDVDRPEPIRLAKGDIFAVISDGIFEATNASFVQFGKERTMALIAEHHRRPPSHIAALIREAVEEFTGGASPADDQTMVLIKASD